MPALAEQITKADLEGLISSGAFGTISLIERRNLERCLTYTTILWAQYIDEKLVGVFGVAPQTLLAESAYLWFWATADLKGHEIAFIRRSRRIMQDELLPRFSRLYGVCEVENHRAIRWLKWLGAKFDVAQSYGVPFNIETV